MSSDEPLSISKLASKAEIAWRNVLVAESQASQPGGCCSDPVWRGHLCPYHEGFADGIDVVLDRLHSIQAMLDEGGYQ